MLLIAFRWQAIADQDEGHGKPVTLPSARDLREEAERMRGFALTASDPDMRAEIAALIAELEVRARQFGNGTAAGG